MLLGWRSQKHLGLLHKNWPGVIHEETSAETANQVKQKEGGSKDVQIKEEKHEKMKDGKEKPFFPGVDSELYLNVMEVLIEYIEVFNDELDVTDR